MITQERWYCGWCQLFHHRPERKHECGKGCSYVAICDQGLYQLTLDWKGDIPWSVL